MSRPSRCVRARLVPALRQDWHDDAVDDLSRLRRWEDAGGTGRPRIVALSYFSLGAEHTEESLHNLLDRLGPGTGDVSRD